MSKNSQQVLSSNELRSSNTETNFHQPPSSTKEEASSSFIQIPGYPQGERSADTIEGINCSEVTGNGKYYM